MSKTLPLAVVISAVDRASAPLARLGARVSAFGEQASRVGAGLTLGVTAPVVGLFTLAARKALEVERAMHRLRVTSGATAEDLAAAAKQANAVPGDFDPKDGLDALTQMGKLGLTLSQSLQALPHTTNLAIAAEAGLADASLQAVKVLRSYGLELDQVARVTDLLTQANATSELGLAGVADNLVQIAPLARELGLGLEEMAAASIALGKVSAQPISVLRTSMVALLKPSKQAAEALTRLHIRRSDLFDSNDKLRGMAHTVEVLSSRAATARDLVDIFGKKAGPGMAALLQQGSGQLLKTGAYLGKVGAGAEQATMRLEGAEGALWELDNTVDDLLLTLSSSGLMENIKSMAKGLANTAKAANEMSPSLVTAGLTAATVAAALGPVIWTTGKLFAGVEALKGAWVSLTAVLAPVAAALGLPAAALGGLLLALPLAIVYMDELNAAVDRLLGTWFEDNVMDTKLYKLAEWFFTAGTVDSGSAIAERRANRQAAAGAKSAAAAPGTSEVVVRFEGAPAGTRASVTQATGMGVAVDMGWAMIPG